jgi:ElaB/YqjD/DUF883 family membrane-anchored ribosome-binding protein
MLPLFGSDLLVGRARRIEVSEYQTSPEWSERSPLDTESVATTMPPNLAPFALKEEKMAEHDLGKELDAVREDMAKLRSDLGSVAEALRDVTRERAEAAKSGLRDLTGNVREELRKSFDGVRDRSRKSMESMEEQIEQKPLMSLLVAFGAGMLLGKLLDRS